MSNAVLDVVGTPVLLSLGTAPLTLGTMGAGSLKFVANGAQVGAKSATGRNSQKLSVTNYATGGDYAVTAAAIASGIITRDPTGGNRTDTLPTAALLLAAVPALSYDGATFICYYINTADGAETITLAVNTDLTISNVGQTIGQDEAAILLIRRTSATEVVVYILGA